ncbi:hypothetical protein SAMN06265222_11631 [Neorhodopirellula lusitana]|uniref:Uncharacterized protein n=2 Tax=Neorhodopirellula lusitana TaxID=445327 RepID=A0ABY1QK18_9BACT|nr:hypothetical protein SAMN06265222_11631 [Neorhodopirellula lusitana]
MESALNMKTILTCVCGKRLSVVKGARAKKVKCPGCAALLSVPATAAASPTSSTAAQAQASNFKLKCRCGQILSLKAEMRGKKVRCPGCSQTLQVPAANGRPRPAQAPLAQPVRQPASGEDLWATLPSIAKVAHTAPRFEGPVTIQPGSFAAPVKKPSAGNRSSGSGSFEMIVGIVAWAVPLVCFLAGFAITILGTPSPGKTKFVGAVVMLGLLTGICTTIAVLVMALKKRKILGHLIGGLVANGLIILFFANGPTIKKWSAEMRTRHLVQDLDANRNSGPPVSEDAMKVSLKNGAKQIGDATMKNNVSTIIAMTYPPMVKLAGGSPKYESITRDALKAMQAKGIKIDAYNVSGVRQIVEENGKHFAIVDTSLSLTSPGGMLTTSGYLLGISTDGGRSWTYLDGNGVKDEKLRARVLPDLPRSLVLPANG